MMCCDVPAKFECVLFFFLNEKHNENEMNMMWQYILKQWHGMVWHDMNSQVKIEKPIPCLYFFQNGP